MQSALSLPNAADIDPGQLVWDRLWAYEPSDEKDDRLLQRESTSRRWELIVDHLTRKFPGQTAIRTIELGSGRGDLSVLLAQRGAQVTLLDRSTAGLQQARYRFSRLGLTASFEQADIFELPPAVCGRFDIALSSGVIEHFQGTRRTDSIRAHFDALRPGGLAIISVPNAWCLPYRLWKVLLELRRRWPYGVEVPYTRRELNRRARAAGFSVEKTFGVEFLRSVQQLRRTLTGSPMTVGARRSLLDSSMGLALVQFARRPGGNES
jgi:2-polyprenyl-3-methyl-5-hydroxy-6-metoxy-1,4-benzoquinol methylase